MIYIVYFMCAKCNLIKSLWFNPVLGFTLKCVKLKKRDKCMCYCTRWYHRQNWIFTFIWPCIVTNFKLDELISQIYFGMKLYMFRTVSLSIIRSLFTVHTAMVYVIQVCRQLSGRTMMELNSILVLLESCLHTCMTYIIAVCTVNKLLMMDRRTVRNM